MYRKLAALFCGLFLFQGVVSAAVPGGDSRTSGERVGVFGVIE